MTKGASSRSLRVLAIHRYYWPDTPPYASMLRAMASRWSADGHRIDVLSTQPSYKQRVVVERQPAKKVQDGVTVRRLDLPSEHGRPLTRLANVLRFAWSILRHARRDGPYDVITVSTVPPVIAAAAARIAARLADARFVYHCMDIHPEIGRLSGEFRNPALFWLLRRIDASNCRAATRVIVLSRDMVQAVRARPGSAEVDVRVINNFNLPSFSHSGDSSLPHDLRKKAGSFRLLFAGNIGRFQGLEAIIDAMHELATQADVELVFLGDGRAVDAMKSRAGSLLGTRIKFFPHQPVGVARGVIRTADLCLVTLIPEVIRFAYPSKTMTYLGEGRPLLASVEPESELAEFVREQGIGVTVGPNDPHALASAIIGAVTDPKKLQEMARSAARVGAERFDESLVLKKWSELMRELALEV